MTRAISRDSFDELKQYVGVHLQQGRVLLDSDWNEGQDIMAALARRVGQDALQDGVLHDGFEIQPAIPVPWGESNRFELHHVLTGLPFLLRFPLVPPLDAFDSTVGWVLTGSPGNLRISRDQPYEGKTFLRLSGHTGTVQLTKTLPSPIDLSAFQYLHFRIRLNQSLPDPLPAASFFIEDSTGKRNAWPVSHLLGNAKDAWIPCAALPLDLRFQIIDLELLPAIQNEPHVSMLLSVGAPATPVTWAVSSGSLPDGLRLEAQFDSNNAHIVGTPTAVVDRTFTITATSASTSVSRTFTMHVQAPPTFAGRPPRIIASFGTLEFFWEQLRSRATRTGSPPTGANLSSITKYGFEVFQQGTEPLIWDFDALFPGSRHIVNTVAANNFVISGPLETQKLNLRQSFSQMAGGFGRTTVDALVPRAYVGGLACAQQRDMLYSEQADPNDPPLVAPTSGVRTDVAYLDVWREPVTYVEDPDLREIALGGPDTSTRMRVRQRVRVAQGGTLPAGNGTGQGTLSTEGSYTGRTNRLYLVEIDTAGDIGTATVRWSEDNGSTIQPVIETIPPSSTTVKVEDASAFQPGDLILLRKEFKEEEHRIAGIFGNRITLQEPTGASTTFAVTDRPKVQRWNRFRAPIVADANDATISAPIDLSFGVKVRLGGKQFRRGDFWTFRTRHLAGDAISGIAPASRIESLEFQRPHGVIHHYMPLALILRDPAAQDPGRVKIVRDRRPRAGHVVCHGPFFKSVEQTGEIPVPLFDIDLGTTSSESRFLSIWSVTFNTNVQGARFVIDIILNNALDESGVGSFDALLFTATTTQPGTQELAKILNLNRDSMFPPDAMSRMSATVHSITPGATFNIGVALTLIELKNQLENTNRFF